jgi:hypothetical protein
MLVTRVAYGAVELSLTTEDCDVLGFGCGVAVENLPGEEDATTRSLLEAFQAVFVASFHATRLQSEVPVTHAGENGTQVPGCKGV